MKKFSRDLAWLFILALLIRWLAALPQQQPNYMDAAYSYVNALNLVDGRGFVEDFVWNYLGNPPPPPHPSHLYWMPLTSILAWWGMAIGGASYRAAQLPFILVSALLAPISYWAARVLSGQRRQGWLAGLFAIFSGFYFPFWTAIDNFTPFAVAGSLALLFAWAGLNESAKQRVGEAASQRVPPAPQPLRPLAPLFYLATAGICIGLAHLARADGFLFLITIVLYLSLWFYFYATRRHRHAGDTPQCGASLWDASRFTFQASRLIPYALRSTLYPVLGYALMMTPWFIRNWQVTGAILPAAGSQTIWLSGYDELFSYGRELSAQTFIAQGLGPVLRGRWWALTANLQTVLAVWGMIFLAPLVAVGGWALRRRPLVQLAGLYAALLFVVMTVVFAFPGARGGLFHSGTALLPFIYALAAIGLDRAVDWVTARRRHWDAPVAKQFFGAGLVVMAMALSGYIYYNRVLRNDAWNSADKLYVTIADWVAQEDPAATVMINNPPAYRYHGGGLSVVVPDENLAVALQAAHRYQVDYLILDSNHPAPLAKVYNQPTGQPGLALVKTLGAGTGAEVYIFKLVEP